MNKTGKIILGGAGVIAAGVAGYFIIRALTRGPKGSPVNATPPPPWIPGPGESYPQPPVPNTGSGSSGQAPAAYDAMPLADELYDAMESNLAWWSTKVAAWNKVLNLTDSQLKTLNSTFNQKYSRKNYPTLRSWMKGEWGTSGLGTPFPDPRPQIYKRMDALGIQ